MAQPTTCPRCAKRLPPAAKFCRRCGMTQKVSASAAAAAGTAFPLPPMPSVGPVPFPSYAPFPPSRPTPAGRPIRPPTGGPSCGTGRGAWGSGWIIGLLVIFCVRACITTTSRHWHSDSPPVIAPAPPLPPVGDPDDRNRYLQEERDPFKRNYVPETSTSPPPPTEAPAPSGDSPTQ
jgi:hypothetical protein